MTDRDLTQRITDYLTGGGLFNPEMANHEAVRDLLIDCRDELTKFEPPFKLSDAGADTNIPLWGLEPKGSGMVVLNQPEQEPVAWKVTYGGDVYFVPRFIGNPDGKAIPLYTAPPKREWVGLTEDEMRLMCHNDDNGDWNDLQQRRFWRETYLAGAKAAQDELKKRNT